jgi:hypothetical protein
MCRWLERDPAGYQDGPSLYSYLGRNPMAGTDPYGLAEGGQGGQSGNWIEINEGSIRRVRVDNTWVRGKDGVVTGTVHIAINDTSSPELHKQNRYFYNPDTDTFVNGHGHQLSTRDVARLRGNERFKRELGRRLENLRALAPGKLRFQTFAPGTGKTTFTNTSMLMISALLMLYTASDAVANSPHYARLVSAIKNGSTASANQEAKNIHDVLLESGVRGIAEGWWALWEGEIAPLLYAPQQESQPASQAPVCK